MDYLFHLPSVERTDVSLATTPVPARLHFRDDPTPTSPPPAFTVWFCARCDRMLRYARTWPLPNHPTAPPTTPTPPAAPHRRYCSRTRARFTLTHLRCVNLFTVFGLVGPLLDAVAAWLTRVCCGDDARFARGCSTPHRLPVLRVPRYFLFSLAHASVPPSLSATFAVPLPYHLPPDSPTPHLDHLTCDAATHRPAFHCLRVALRLTCLYSTFCQRYACLCSLLAVAFICSNAYLPPCSSMTQYRITPGVLPATYSILVEQLS